MIRHSYIIKWHITDSVHLMNMYYTKEYIQDIMELDFFFFFIYHILILYYTREYIKNNTE